MNWNKVKGLFVEVDESADPPPSKKKSTPPPAAAASIPTTPAPTVIPVDASQGQKDQAIIDSLAKALSDSNLPGFDYFEFAQILEKLSTSIPSEQMRFQTAFASAAVMGATKPGLSDSIVHYLKVLENEAQKFTQMVTQEIKVKVTDKEASVGTIDTTIKEKSDQITRLTQEINELTSTRTTILNESAANNVSIQKIQNDFAACLKVFIDKINGDATKINQYIPEASK